MGTYTCAQCGETFNKIVTDEEAWQETEKLFGTRDIEDPIVICDDCFLAIFGPSRNTQ